MYVMAKLIRYQPYIIVSQRRIWIASFRCLCDTFPSCYDISLSLSRLCLPLNANSSVQEILITTYLIFQSRTRYYRMVTNPDQFATFEIKSSHLEAYQMERYKITLAPLSIMPYSRALRSDWNLERQPMGIAVTWPGKISPRWKL